MEFMQRGGQTRSSGLTRNSSGVGGAAGGPGVSGSAGVPSGPDGPSGKRLGLPTDHAKWTRVGFLILLFAGTILAVASLFFLAFGKGVYKERQFVNKESLQAVFINVNGTNGGQVYFGNISDMTQQYIRLTNVFYIQNQQNTQTSQTNNSAYNLVKLGCELHGPEDVMLINRSEVFFWENLKPDSQVAQKVAEFHKQNPDGQKCTTSDSQNQQSSGNTQTPANNAAPAAGTSGGTAPQSAPKPTPAPAGNSNE